MNKFITAIKEFFQFLYNAKFLQSLKVLFIIIVLGFTISSTIICYSVFKSQETTNTIVKRLLNNEDEQLLVRDEIATPYIQKQLNNMCYQLDADRVVVMEFHNGKTNSAGLPFSFVDMNYEEINETHGIEHIAGEYMNIPISHYKYPIRLREVKQEVLTIDELRNYDPLLASEIKYGKVIGFYYLVSNGKPIGILAVFFNKTNIDKEKLNSSLQYYGAKISSILDIKTTVS